MYRLVHICIIMHFFSFVFCLLTFDVTKSVLNGYSISRILVDDSLLLIVMTLKVFGIAAGIWIVVGTTSK